MVHDFLAMVMLLFVDHVWSVNRICMRTLKQFLLNIFARSERTVKTIATCAESILKLFEESYPNKLVEFLMFLPNRTLICKQIKFKVCQKALGMRHVVVLKNDISACSSFESCWARWASNKTTRKWARRLIDWPWSWPFSRKIPIRSNCTIARTPCPAFSTRRWTRSWTRRVGQNAKKKYQVFLIFILWRDQNKIVHFWLRDKFVCHKLLHSLQVRSVCESVGIVFLDFRSNQRDEMGATPPHATKPAVFSLQKNLYWWPCCWSWENVWLPIQPPGLQWMPRLLPTNTDRLFVAEKLKMQKINQSKIDPLIKT